MNLEIYINKDTCFYYWAQVMSHWSPNFAEVEALHHYKNLGLILSKKQQAVLDKMRQILQEAEEPRWILAELYSGSIKTNEAEEIARQTQQLKSNFEPVWQMSLPRLEESVKHLKAIDFTRFAEPMRKIVSFLDSDFDIQDKYAVYLLPNPLHRGPMGHTINKTRFMLVRPSGDTQIKGVNDTIATIAHEYIHAIENRSRINRTVIKKSYDEYIGKNGTLPPLGYVWKEMYVEALVYCCASKTIGGYLSQEIYQKPSLTTDEIRDKFQNLVKQNKHSAYHIMNWAALNILPDVEIYIERGERIDKKIADILSKVFLEFI